VKPADMTTDQEDETDKNPFYPPDPLSYPGCLTPINFWQIPSKNLFGSDVNKNLW
jgi:hypothetical protein